MSYSESILVVNKAHLSGYLVSGFQYITDIGRFTDLIQAAQEFHERGLMEEDERYVQLIPYIVYRYEQQLFVMERSAKASEQRLASKLSLGIGGHIRQSDMTDNSLISWAKRELHEEVALATVPEIQVMGLIYDPSNVVGRVHLGVLMFAQGTDASIAIKDEHQSGRLMTLNEIAAVRERFETWSTIALDALTPQLMPEQQINQKDRRSEI